MCGPATLAVLLVQCRVVVAGDSTPLIAWRCPNTFHPAPTRAGAVLYSAATPLVQDEARRMLQRLHARVASATRGGSAGATLDVKPYMFQTAFSIITRAALGEVRGSALRCYGAGRLTTTTVLSLLDGRCGDWPGERACVGRYSGEAAGGV